jgi:hypothetical protein
LSEKKLARNKIGSNMGFKLALARKKNIGGDKAFNKAFITAATLLRNTL